MSLFFRWYWVCLNSEKRNATGEAVSKAHGRGRAKGMMSALREFVGEKAATGAARQILGGGAAGESRHCSSQDLSVDR